MLNKNTKTIFVIFVASLLFFSVAALIINASIIDAAQANLVPISDNVQTKVEQGPIIAPLTGPEWPQHGNGPKRNCFQIGTAPDSNHVLWRKNYMAILHPPIVVNNKVISHGNLAGKFEEADGFFFALDADTGEEVWRTPTTADLYSGWSEGNLILAIDENRFMYITPGFFHIYEIETGKLIMDFQAGNYLGFGGVFVPESMTWIGVGSYTTIGGQTIEAWDFSDRNGPPTMLWRSDPVELIDTRSFYENGRYHIGSNEFTEYCYDATTGEMLWSTDVRGFTSFYGCAADGKIFRGSIGNYLWAFEPETGKILWEFRPQDDFGRVTTGYFSGSTAAAYGKVYQVNTDGHIYALDAETGELLWKFQANVIAWGAARLWYPQYPAIADGKLYYLVADRRTGIPTTGMTYFVCIDAETGELIWHAKDFAEIRCPAIAYGRLYGQDFIYDRGVSTADWKLDSSLPNATGAYMYCFGKGETAFDFGTDTHDVHNLEYVIDGQETTFIGQIEDLSPSKDWQLPDGSAHLAIQLPVKLSWQLPDGTQGEIGTVTTDWYGKLFYKWLPPTPGEYTVTAEILENGAYNTPGLMTTELLVVRYWMPFPRLEAAVMAAVLLADVGLIFAYIRKRRRR